jgi:urease accessory protein UreE
MGKVIRLYNAKKSVVNKEIVDKIHLSKEERVKAREYIFNDNDESLIVDVFYKDEK